MEKVELTGYLCLTETFNLKRKHISDTSYRPQKQMFYEEAHMHKGSTWPNKSKVHIDFFNNK